MLFKEPVDFNESDLVSSVPSDRFESFHVAAHDDRIYSAVLHLDTNIDGGRSVFVNDSVFTDLYVLSHIYILMAHTHTHVHQHTHVQIR